MKLTLSTILKLAWIIITSIVIIVGPYSEKGGYLLTPPYFQHKLGFVHISIVEAFILCILLVIILSKAFNRKKTIKIESMGLLLLIGALVIWILAVLVRNYLNGSFVFYGLAELKAIIVITTCVAISRCVFTSKDERYYLFFPITLLVGRLCYELAKYGFFPYVDAIIGPITFVPGLTLFFFPILLALFFTYRFGIARMLALLGIFLSVIVVIFSRSRISFLIMIVTLVIESVFFKLRIYNRKFSLAKFYIIFGTLLIVLFISVVSIANNDFIQSYVFWNENPQIEKNFSNIGHFDDIKRGLMFIKDSPVTGYGVGGNLPSYGAAVFSGVIHNELLHFWVTFGFLGMLYWIFLFVIIPIKAMGAFSNLRYFYHQHSFILRYAIFSVPPIIAVKLTVSPPFYYNFPEIWFVSALIALELNLLHEKVIYSKKIKLTKGID
jgi:O-antigen ligase